MKTIITFILAAWMAVWPCYANPLLMLAGSPPVAESGWTSVASDNFDSYTAGSLLQDAANWGASSSTAYVRKPASDGAVYAYQRAWYDGRTWADDQRTEVTLQALQTYNESGPAVRVSASALTGYVVQCAQNSIRLKKVVSSTYTTLQSDTTAGVVQNGYKVSIEVTGTDSATRLKVQIDSGSGWVTKWENVDPGSTYINSGYAGIIGVNSSANEGLLDDWIGYE